MNDFSLQLTNVAYDAIEPATHTNYATFEQ